MVQANVAPLPCMTDAPLDTLFDLWSAHRHSGATDESQVRTQSRQLSGEGAALFCFQACLSVCTLLEHCSLAWG